MKPLSVLRQRCVQTGARTSHPIVALGIPVHAIGVDLRKQSRLDRLDYMSDQTGGTSNLVGDPNLLDDSWEP
ncbi:hypothetical protein N9B73_11535 [Verrucomicrobiales bacterium]|nr:hypothetical protein [Verrucomicrobiales bacterium]